MSRRYCLPARTFGKGEPSEPCLGCQSRDNIKSLLLAHGGFQFDKMVPGMLDPEMIEDTAKSVNDAVNDRYRVNLIINNRAGGNAPLIAEKIADRLHSMKPQGLF